VTEVLQDRQTGLLPPHEKLTGARLRLFEAALDLFGDRGYHAVSVKDIMAQLGQQPGALYFHVPSKQHLLYELVYIGTDVHRTRIRQSLLEAGTEPADQVRSIVEAHVRVHLEYAPLARVTTREVRSLTEDQRATIMAAREDAWRILTEVVDRGVRKEVFSVAVPLLALHAIASMGVQAAEWWKPEFPHDITEIAANYADYAVKLLGA
jgi:AcrR family transcriptional regulator